MCRLKKRNPDSLVFKPEVSLLASLEGSSPWLHGNPWSAQPFGKQHRVSKPAPGAPLGILWGDVLELMNGTADREKEVLFSRGTPICLSWKN